MSHAVRSRPLPSAPIRFHPHPSAPVRSRPLPPAPARSRPLPSAPVRSRPLLFAPICTQPHRTDAGGAYTLVRAVGKLGEPPLVPVLWLSAISVVGAGVALLLPDGEHWVWPSR